MGKVRKLIKGRRKKGILLGTIATIEGAIIINLWANTLSKSETFWKTVIIQAVTVIISIAASIISSSIYTFIDKDESVSEESLRKIVDQLGMIERIKYAPDRVYVGTDLTYEEFNKNLNSSIKKTEHYYYMGDKAKFTAKRLKNNIQNYNSKLSIEIFIPDIREKDLFKARSKQLQRESRHHGHRSKEELILREKMDIIKSMYLLWSLKDRFDIYLYLHKEIPLYRLEITDNMLVMSLLPALVDGNYYPITFVYENESQLRETYKDYLAEVKERSTTIKLDTVTMEYFEELGKEYIREDFSISDLENCDLVEGEERNAQYSM